MILSLIRWAVVLILSLTGYYYLPHETRLFVIAIAIGTYLIGWVDGRTNGKVHGHNSFARSLKMNEIVRNKWLEYFRYCGYIKDYHGREGFIKTFPDVIDEVRQ